MPDLNDRHTDELFQVGAQRHDFEYNPAAWEQMEVLLDTDARRQRWKLIGAALLSLLLLGLLFWFTTDRSAPVGNNGRGNVAERPAPEPAQLATTTVPKTATPKSAAPVETSGKSVEGGVGGSTTSRRQTTAGARTTASEDPFSAPALVQKTTDEAVSTAIPHPKTAPIRVDETAAAAFSGHLLPALPIELVERPEVTAALPDVPSEAAFDKRPRARNFALIASGGAILGRSGADPFERVRPRLGVELEYRYGGKFALSGGLFYNAVCYKTAGENFTDKESFWHDQTTMPTEVIGECNVLEIPLSLKYYVSGSANNSLYLGGGASTYIVLAEDYEYFYDRPADNLKKDWSGRMDSRHPFGMGHFSLGYQRQLRGRSALKLEGFVQLPFTGIGVGDVRLVTSGVSLNYQFGLKRR